MGKKKLATDVIAALREENKALQDQAEYLRVRLDAAEARLFADTVTRAVLESVYQACRVLARKVPDTEVGKRAKLEARKWFEESHLKPPHELLRKYKRRAKP